jgi:transglutaminase-like putative cysteine protease
MKLNPLILFLVVSLLYLNTTAQNFKLGKVSIEELQEKSHPKDSSAVAAMLYNTGEVRFLFSQNKGFETVTVVQTRIKIYKKGGYDWATREIPYYLGSNGEEKIYISEAVTYNLVGGKTEKTKLKSDGEFDEEINKYWGSKKITMPNVKEGSVIEYEYTIRSPRVSELKDWSFQSSIPVNYSEFTTYVPEYFVYNSNQKGYFSPKVTFESSEKSIVIESKERIGGDSFSNQNTTTIFSKDKINYQETKTTYLAENSPAMKEEAFVNNVTNYMSSISHELAFTKYPNSTIEYYVTDWETVSKKIYENDDFGAELNKTGYFEEDIAALLVGLVTPEDKINAIFSYVKTNVKWNDYYGYSCKDGVKQAYKNKVGNVAEINLMLTAMLRHAGFTANPVLISTRSNGIARFPNRAAFNYVIAGVEMSNGLLLLDASDRFSTPNILPLRVLNWVGRLIRKDGTSQEVDLMPKVLSNDIVMMNYEIDATGKVSGDVTRQRTDYNAMVFRESVGRLQEDAYLEDLENNNNKIEINEYSRTNEKDLKLPVVEMFSYSGANFSEIIDEVIYINPMLFFAVEQNPFKQELREYPTDFGYPSQNKYNINIKIPAGYRIESIPDVINIAMPDSMASFKYIIAKTEDSLQLFIASNINAAIISSEYYQTLKDFFQQVVDKESEKIILTKI